VFHSRDLPSVNLDILLSGEPLQRFFQESSDINVTFEGVQKRTVEAFSEESSSIFLALGRLSSFVLVRRFLPAKKLEHC
jgi:hypothetical protein